MLASGLETGDRLVLTPLGTGMEGVEVKTREAATGEPSRDTERSSTVPRKIDSSSADTGRTS